MTFDEIMEQMLSKVPDDVDAREGSIIYTALAPIAAMCAEQQAYLDILQDVSMPDTAGGDDLTRVCAQFGVSRKAASNAVRKAIFGDMSGVPTDVPIGSRFGAEGILYTVTGKITTGEYMATCQQVGSIGNRYFGAILPIDSVPNLGTATLGEVLVAGEETETDDALRARFYERAATQPFGGNVAQYRKEVLAVDGVGGVVVYPTPDGQGGKVQCVIVTPDHKPASATLIQTVQNKLDPPPSGGGYGMAPIGHHVTVSTVTEATINVATTIALSNGYTLDAVRAAVTSAIVAYLASIAFVDSVVRIARIDSAILDIPGIADVRGTALNGTAANITLPAAWNNYQVPKLGAVTIAEVT